MLQKIKKVFDNTLCKSINFSSSFGGLEKINCIDEGTIEVEIALISEARHGRRFDKDTSVAVHVEGQILAWVEELGVA